jgi:hypothetical protein
MSKHTPTPWLVGKKAGRTEKVVYTVDDGEVALFGEFWPRTPEAEAQALANAERVAACVNALAGIEGEALDLLPRVLVDMQRELPAGYDGGSGPSDYELAHIGLAALPLLKALRGAIK